MATKKILSVTEAQSLLNERFGEGSKVAYMSSMDKEEGEVWQYCFTIDYTNLTEKQVSSYAYVWVNSVTGFPIFQEAGYTDEGGPRLYTNLPDSMFPVPMVDGTVIPYEWFDPPYHDNDISISYAYDDESVMGSYQAQLADAGFNDMGEAMSVDSLWVYERKEDGATLVVEMFTDGEGFSMAMYVNYLERY